MLDKKQYYRLLSSIPFENGDNVNGQGFVALGLPFKYAPDAVKYAMAKTPEFKRDENPVVQNKALCRQLSAEILPEVDRLMICVERMISESTEKLKSLADQRDGKPNDIIGNVERCVLQESVMQQIGYNAALHDVWQTLNKRRFELWECSRLKKP